MTPHVEPESGAGPPGNEGARARRTAAFLATATVLLYSQTAWFDFAYFDDHHFVVETEEVLSGLQWANFKWAFTEAPYSCPLAWVSHMADCSLFGTWAGGHHLMNVAFHAVNVVLLFQLLLRLSGRAGPALVVAALFGWHPTHVESVAWIAERRDVLSTMFMLLAMHAYLRHATAPHWTRLAIVFASLLAGLLVKAMLITTPFVLMLLDAWPLRRWDPAMLLSARGTSRGDEARKLGRLLLEKVPLFALTAWFTIEGYLTASRMGALSSEGPLSIADRMSNSVLHLARYLGITFWPAGLAAYYPLEPRSALWLVALAALLAVAITAFAASRWRTSPWLAVGWFWFVGMLVPVIGLVQGGRQSIADRYLYVPHIGLFIALVWETASRLDQTPGRMRIARLGTAVVLAGCLVLSAVQLRHWKDAGAVFSRILANSPDHWFAHTGLGTHLARHGRHEEAAHHFERAFRLRPESNSTQFNYAWVLSKAGRHDEARAVYRTAFLNRGPMHDALKILAGLDADARQRATNPDAWHLAATANLTLGRSNDAAVRLRRVVELDPSRIAAGLELAQLLTALGDRDSAAHQYREVLQHHPTNDLAHANLGGLLTDQGKLDEALVHLAAAHSLNPGNPATRYNLALALARRGRHCEAVAHFRDLLRTQPTHVNALNRLGWTLATSGDDGVRNGPEALRLALQLQEATGRKQALAFDTEAAALAECGRFEDAVVAARRGLELATATKAEALASGLAARLKLYEARTPIREPAGTQTPP